MFLLLYHQVSGITLNPKSPAVGHPGRQGRPLQGPAAALSRAVRLG